MKTNEKRMTATERHDIASRAMVTAKAAQVFPKSSAFRQEEYESRVIAAANALIADGAP